MFLSIIEDKIKRGLYTAGVKHPGNKPLEPVISMSSKYFSQVWEEYGERIKEWKTQQEKFVNNTEAGVRLFKKEVIDALKERGFTANQSKNAFVQAASGDKDFIGIIEYLRDVDRIFNGE